MKKLTYLPSCIVLSAVVFTAKAEAQTTQQPVSTPTNLTSNDEKNIEALINQASEDIDKGN